MKKTILLLIVALTWSNLIAQTQVNVNNIPKVFSSSDFKPVDLNKIDNSLRWLQPMNNSNFQTVNNSVQSYWKDRKDGKGNGWKPYKRWEYFWAQRLSDNSKLPNVTNIYKNWLSKKIKNPKTNAETEWKALGPKNKPKGSFNLGETGIGRMNCVAFDHGNPNILWAGAAFGGVWKSINGGTNWVSFPFTQFLSIGITDIAVANTGSSPNQIVYAATGDADASFGGIGCYSIGVIKTTDGGENWSITNFTSQISDQLIINRILVDPRDENHVYTATTRGLFVTKDGGASWDTLTTAYTRDLEFKPDNPDRLWAAFIYGDGTNTFYGLFKVSIFPKQNQRDSVTFNSTPAVFNYGEVLRMSIAVNENNPNYVYVLSANHNGGLHSVIYTPSGADKEWFFLAQTLDSGIGNYTWDLLNARSDEPDSIKSPSQGFYDLCIASDPNDPMAVYIGGVNIWKFKANGQPWELTGYWTERYISSGIPYIHADQHSLTFDQDGNLYSACDGGLFKYNKDAKFFDDLSDGLEVTQFYRINAAKNNPDLIICGAQDNGTMLKRDNQWLYVRGGDGMDCQIDPFNSQVMYASLYYGDFAVSRDGGDSFQPLINKNVTNEEAEWVAPFVIDPVIPDDIYAGYQNVWKAGRKGLNPWKRITNFEDTDPITHMVIPRADHKIIYIIKPKGIWRSTDAGDNWSSVVTGNGNLLLTGVAVDPQDPLHFWFSRGGFVEDEKVFEYREGSLYKFSDGIPNVSANCIVINRNSPNHQMFVGTDIGVFFKDDDMNQWEIYGSKLPNVVIQDLDINYQAKKLRAATYGRGLWEVNIISCSLESPTINSSTGSNKLCIGDTMILSVEGDYANYKWSTSETSKSITITEAGIYNVTVVDKDGCTAISDNITVAIVDPPDIKVKNSFGKTGFCEGDSIKLSASPSIFYKTFDWSNGQTGKDIWVNTAASYYVTGHTKEGCSKTSQPFDVQMYQIPDKPEITVDGNLLTSSEAISYQWYFNDVEIKGAVNMTHTANKTGNYKVMVKNENDCSNMSDDVYVEVVGIEEINDKVEISIQPNPSKDIFNLIIEKAGNHKLGVVISDIIGTKILTIPTINLSNNIVEKIDLSNFANGIYFVNIHLGSKVLVKKIIKK